MSHTGETSPPEMAAAASKSPKHTPGSHTPKPSKFIGNYEILKTIGEGSFAKVKLGTHRLTGQKVAIKVIDKNKLHDDYALKNLHREAHILRLVDHSNIVQLFEVMETKKGLFLILEYAPGGEILDLIMSKGKLSEDLARKCANQVVSALDYLHSHKIAHRDLKAENLLLDEDMNIKLSDFGLSNTFDTSSTLLTSCGSPVYSAPELLEGKRYTGPEVDMWSLGVIIYAMIAGELPFADSNLSTLYESIVHAKYTIPDFASNECKDLISKLLVVNPKKRLTSGQVKDHPWLTRGSTFLDPFESNEGQGFRPKKESELDTSILDEMEQMGIDREQIMQSVINGKFNQPAGTYYILSYQKQKDFVAFSMGAEERNKKSKEIKDTSLSATPATSKRHDDNTSEELARVLFQVQREQQDLERAAEMDQQQHPPLTLFKPERPSTAGKALGYTNSLKGRRSVKGASNTSARPESFEEKVGSLDLNKPQGKEDKPLQARLSISKKSPAMDPKPAVGLSTRKASVLANSTTKEPAEVIRKESVKQIKEEPLRTITPASASKSRRKKSNEHFSIDESLYTDEKAEGTAGPMGNPRTIKLAFNCQATSSLHADELFNKLRHALDKNDVDWSHDRFFCICNWGDVKLEAEICKIPHLTLHGLRLKKLSGDIWEFKKFSSKICTDMGLS